MAELSARSGVTAPTIRFYLREGLLQPGRLTSPNQAVYNDAHVRRLRLVRALLEIGGLSVDAARSVISAMEAKTGNTFAVLGQVHYALTPARQSSPPAHATNLTTNETTSEAASEVASEVEAVIARRGWRVRVDNPARASLAQAIATLRAVGRTELLDAMDAYAQVAESLAQREIDELMAIEGEEARAEAVIAATVLGDALLSALRRLAQESILADTADTADTGRGGRDDHESARR